MKQVFTNSISDLKRSYTNLTIALVVIGAISSFFTHLTITDNDFLNVLHVVYFLACSTSLLLMMLPILVYLEEYLETTRFSKISIASLFVENANHVKANIVTILVLISIVYAVISVLTAHIFAAAVIFWFLTWLAAMFS